MTNSICLSSDMRKLYLIDDERAITFDLTSNNGVLVGIIRDQLTAVTAAKPMPDTIQGKTINRLRLPVKNSQFTVIYHPNETTMFIIGATDISGNIQISQEPLTKIKSLNLSEGAVNIRRVNNDLEFAFKQE